MNRKNFFRNAAGLIAIATSAKELASLAPKPITDLPGICGETVVAKYRSGWFVPGDILCGVDVATPNGIMTMYRIKSQEDDYDVLECISGDPEHRNLIHVWQYPESAKLLCSTYG